ncbi:MAG: S-layer homology domain-containing protein, partial [Tumebacillaceae bacterium]
TVLQGGSASLTVAASGGVKLSYQWYSNTTNSTSGGTAINGATDATYTAPTGSAGTTYYYCVVTNTDSGATGQTTATATSAVATITVNALTNVAMPTIDTQPADQTVSVGSNASLTVAASGGVSLSYQWYSSNSRSTNGGTAINGATSATYQPPTTKLGTTFYYCIVTNTDSSATGQKTASVTSSVARVTVNKKPDNGGGGGNVTPTDPTNTGGVDILVNGKVENAGTATTTTVNNQTVITITVDPAKLDEKLASEGQNAIVTIPVTKNSDVVVGELTGQMVKNMENKQATLVIKTGEATYTLPAQQINIDSVSDQIGKSVALQDIKVQIEIAAPTSDTMKIVDSAASRGAFTLVAPSLDFTVKGLYGDKKVDVSHFNAYVERTIALPDGIDPNKITTGVVVEQDGTVRHVPTKVVKIDGKYYAEINSLTNSTYSVVWHPLEFQDVAHHWAKNAVNDMGSRMVVSGTGEDKFSPDQDITRAEFAAIIVRGLGLKLENGASPFSDVKESDWYSSAIKTAYEYHLINGIGDGTFHPNDKITREQAMYIIASAMKITRLKDNLPAQSVAELLHPYTDAKDASKWALNAIADCVEAGIISGRGNAELAPEANISRAEVAAIVERLLQKSNLI